MKNCQSQGKIRQNWIRVLSQEKSGKNQGKQNLKNNGHHVLICTYDVSSWLVLKVDSCNFFTNCYNSQKEIIRLYGSVLLIPHLITII